jgi:hypothetical protein
MVQTRTKKLNQTTQNVSDKRDSSPERSSSVSDDYWLIIITAREDCTSHQVRIHASNIPPEIKTAIEKHDMAICIEDVLLVQNESFTDEERKQLLGFLKAIGFKMNDEYPSDCASYPHLEVLCKDDIRFLWKGAKIDESFSCRVNFTSEERLLHYTQKEADQFLEWFKLSDKYQEKKKEAWARKFLAYLGIKK